MMKEADVRTAPNREEDPGRGEDQREENVLSAMRLHKCWK